MSELSALAPGVFAWLAEHPAHGHANAGVVVDADGMTIIDVLAVPSQYEPFAAAVEAFGLPVRRLVLSSSNAEFSGGTARFRLAAIYGRAQTSAHLDQEPDPAVLRRLYPELAAEIDDAWTTRPVSHVVDDAVQLTPATTLMPCGGQQAENLVVAVPGAQLVFAGAMCTFGVTPLAYQGDPGLWADALDELVTLAPIIVPGLGPIGGEEEVRDLQAYLRACVDAEGEPSRIASGPWDTWSARHHDAVNVERAAMLARGDDNIPPSFLRLVGL